MNQDQDSLNQFITPIGKAGCDQVDAMIESIHSELKQMFGQVAELSAFEHGVGRTVITGNGPSDKIQLDAQKRECQAQIASHAGRALEVALHVVYARGADRIMGREYPGVDKEQMKKDRKTHSLKYLYDRIVAEFSDRDMKEAFEDVYQTALHAGVTDIYLEGKHVGSFFISEDNPFKEVQRNEIRDGSEKTLDHSEGLRSLFSTHSDGDSTFSRMSHACFESFLGKADAVYYEGDINDRRRNMGWVGYSARDHEYGRPYVIVGSRFFARLTAGIVNLSGQTWTWSNNFKERFHERRLYIIDKLIKAHLMQNYENTIIELPKRISVQESVKRADEWKLLSNNHPKDYTRFHNKLELSSN